MSSQKQIYEYDNYRTFLRDYCEAAKIKDRKYSFRYFSRKAGFVSPSHVKRIIDGERNLSEKGLEKLAHALNLNNEEREFFKNLVFLNQASTHEEREIHAKQILKSRAYRKIHPLSQFQYRYFAHWYYVPIRELVAVPGFKENPEWIAKVIKPQITVEEAREALQELITFGLLIRDENGQLKQSNSNVTFPDSITSNFYIRYHKEMLTKASGAIDIIPRDQRDISGVTFGLSPQGMEKIKEMIKKFREEVLEEAAKHEGINSIYQINLQLFPLSRQILSSKDEKEKK